MKRRVVVTGIGIISSLGTSVEEFWRECLAGHSHVQRVPSHWFEYCDFKSTIWSPLPAIDYAEFGITRVQRMQNDPAALNAILAARQALIYAGWSREAESDEPEHMAEKTRIGVYVGTGIGGAHTFMENHLHAASASARKRLEALAEHTDLTVAQQDVVASIATQLYHPRRINPFMVSMVMPNAVAATLGIHFSLFGPNYTYCQACASGTVAIGNAFRAVREGAVDAALAGGSEYFHDHHGFLFRAFDASGTLVRNCDDPRTANRPFDENRSGFLFGEGASAILILESLDGAKARQAPILAEVSGYAESFDGHSMMAMAPQGREIENVIRASVRDAHLSTDDIDYINAHGTGTLSNDETEAQVIERVFGKKPLINSTKSLVGHTFGASGAVEAAVLALSLHRQTTHPNRNLDDPIADLNFVRSAEEYALSSGLSQSFAFGGHNAAIAMNRP